MAICAHCGTEFVSQTADERYCCQGCGYVAQLIEANGFDRFYDLKRGLAVAPAKSRPFEDHDFSWLAGKVAAAEAESHRHRGICRLELGLEGVSCVGCVWLIERIFSRQDGSVRAAANPASGELHLEWLAGKCNIEAFLRELCQFGYVAAAAIRPGGNHERARLAVRLGLCAAFALNTMAFSLPGYLGMPEDFEFADLFRIIACLSASLSMLVGAGYFIDRAWRSIRVGSLHMDLPIALGLIVAYLGSLIGWAWGVEGLVYFDFVSVFVFLMLGGRYLQTAAVDKNRRRLVRSQPVPVELLSGSNAEEKIPRDALVRGTEFMLQPGQALPVSGLLSAGEADFSLEWIHGEADPVHFGVGSRLPAGAILLSREPAMMTADESWHDSLLSRLTATVTAERAAPGLDRLLRIYLLVVMSLGIAGLVGWAWMGDWLTGAQAMVSVFVVSCPCALGVAVPLADSLAASALERLGVFVRSGSLWSRMRKVDHVVFDKTGTLTLERPQLISPSQLADLQDEEALALARLTSGSLHPVSRSLLENLGFRGQQLLQQRGRRDVREFPGLGVTLDDEGECWSLGKSGWNASDESVQSDSSRSELRKNGNLVASFDFKESLRPDVMRTMHFLKRRGLRPHILSGDHPDKVAVAADVLGIPKNQVHGGLSPEEKAARMREMKDIHALYLGDGANDSLAFDEAFVTGTPVVDRSLLESKADFFTLGSGMGFLPDLFQIAEARDRAVRSAFGFALIYNLSTVLVSLSGMMSPLLAAVLMPLSSLISIAIVCGGVRLNFTDR